MGDYFPKSFRSFGRNINAKVDLYNCATGTYLKNVTHVDTCDTFNFCIEKKFS